MPIGRRLSVFASWIACFAILLTALAPTLSHAFRPDVPAGWIEICSATGAKLIRADDGLGLKTEASGKSDSDSTADHAVKHCPYCSSHATALGLPPAASSGVIALSLGHAVPKLFLTAPRTLFAWAAAQPRGPPLNA
ncbi:DUF2946 domain-containing protein [Roseateles amylovorans]|uniref:DUF2946 domain-containing protein n=1 Tax=Roseateles amylovorans TaxID=2978473 RepID=A0ABY6B223_9BURK|nr:DUF2946 domain-containing protein [Roseateles amylovorans]UXH77568.1 DUF2946 domain-containing protein [Roseateles amylovorans]